MKTVKLISFHPDAKAQAGLLKQPGVVVDSAPLVRTSAVVGEMANLNPAALVLDLDKLPSHAREIALALRASKSARNIPILFAGSLPASDGLPEKYARLRSELPDIPYSIWPDAAKAIAELMKSPAAKPSIVPAPRAYTTSLAQKLGIVPASEKLASKPKPRKIALLAAPDEFGPLLGDLPETVSFTTRITPQTYLALCFVRSLADLAATIDLLVYNLPEGASAWVVYPKGVPKRREFNENDVRGLGVACGFVDYKICSIDAAWSAMKFARRKKA